VQDREHERATLQARLEELAARRQLARLDRSRLDKDLRERLTDWQGLIQQQPQQARQGLRKLLEGRLVFAPTADGTAVSLITGKRGILDSERRRGARPVA
jgi:hypothetical protein